MSNVDFLATSGALGVGSVRLGLRAMLPVTPRFLRKVSDDEVAAFLVAIGSTAGTPQPRGAQIALAR
jgi:hypothetical protein